MIMVLSSTCSFIMYEMITNNRKGHLICETHLDPYNFTFLTMRTNEMIKSGRLIRNYPPKYVIDD